MTTRLSCSQLTGPVRDADVVLALWVVAVGAEELAAVQDLDEEIASTILLDPG